MNFLKNHLVSILIITYLFTILLVFFPNLIGFIIDAIILLFIFSFGRKHPDS